jgi:hypothetical protein
MLIDTMNTDDLKTLQNFRMQRFFYFFAASLQFCPIQIGADNILNIYCPHEESVNDLLNEAEDLHYYAYLILGVHRIVLHLACSEYNFLI